MSIERLQQPVEVEKWFSVEEEDSCIFIATYKYPTNISEAFEKTFAKWYLLAKYGTSANMDDISTCGLCNLYHKWSPEPEAGAVCISCPIYKTTQNHGCEGTLYDVVDSYKRGGFNFKNYIYDSYELAVLAEISFLCRVARETLEPTSQDIKYPNSEKEETDGR